MKAWTAINRLFIIWRSDLFYKIKLDFFQAVAVSVLLYLCTTWMLTKLIVKKLNGNYIRMLHAILNKSWKQHLTKQYLYVHLPPISKSIQVRWTWLARHCWRNKDESIGDILRWIPTHWCARVGQPAWTCLHLLYADTGYSLEDLLGAIDDRDGWRERAREIHAVSMTWWWYIFSQILSCP